MQEIFPFTVSVKVGIVITLQKLAEPRSKLSRKNVHRSRQKNRIKE